MKKIVLCSVTLLIAMVAGFVGATEKNMNTRQISITFKVDGHNECKHSVRVVIDNDKFSNLTIDGTTLQNIGVGTIIARPMNSTRLTAVSAKLIAPQSSDQISYLSGKDNKAEMAWMRQHINSLNIKLNDKERQLKVLQIKSNMKPEKELPVKKKVREHSTITSQNMVAFMYLSWTKPRYVSWRGSLNDLELMVYPKPGYNHVHASDDYDFGNKSFSISFSEVPRGGWKDSQFPRYAIKVKTTGQVLESGIIDLNDRELDPELIGGKG